MRTRSPLVLATLLVASSQPSLASEIRPELWEAWYSVSARVRTGRLDADLEAGGRLEMVELANSAGDLTLSLGRVLEHPWKLYWVDPLGPFGEEVKVASVASLVAASWDALQTAETESQADGSARHRRWLETADRPRALDGTFVFVIIGPARDRFRIEIDPGGTVSRVSNQLTDRWLSGPFDQFIGRWGAESSGPATGIEPVPGGYWFWNRGETEPFGYEPHTYHAFAAALDLLSLALPPVSGPETSLEAMQWEQIARRATRVLATLAPRVKPSAFSVHFKAPIQISATREVLPTGGVRRLLASPDLPAQPHVERETVFSSEDRPVSDRIRVRITAIGGGSLEVEVGYGPLNAKEESK